MDQDIDIVKLLRTEHLYNVMPAQSLNNLFSGITIPQNPGLAFNDWNSGHQDSYCSESVGLTGPTGKKLRLIMQHNPYGFTAIMAANHKGQMVGVAASQDTFTLIVFDSECRIWSATEIGTVKPNVFGGGYFFLNNKDNAVVVSNNKLACYPTINVEKRDSVYPLEPLWTTPDLVETITKSDTTNSLYCAIPVWQREWPGYDYYYWVLLAGNYDMTTSTLKSNAFIAVLEVIADPGISTEGCATRLVDSLELQNQWNNNTIAVSDNGVFFVTNACDDSGACTSGYLHSMRFDPLISKIHKNWSTPYQNSSYLKVGQTNIGSGTTPTLFQGEDGTDLVAITDNAYPRMNVVICDRKNGKIIDEVPVFSKMRGCDEASLIGVKGHIVVENNFGHTFDKLMLQSQYVPNESGLAMIKVKSAGGSEIVWESGGYPSGFFAMSMLARESGIIFAHLCDWNVADSSTKGGLYSIVAIDSWDGRIIWRIPLGQGRMYCHEYGGIYFSRTSGTSLYMGTQEYLVSIQDYEDNTGQ